MPGCSSRPRPDTTRRRAASEPFATLRRDARRPASPSCSCGSAARAAARTADPPRGAARARRARVRRWPEWVAPALVDGLARPRHRRAVAHQVEAAEAAHAGRHVVLSTGTASGKSLAYLLPALTAVLPSRASRGGRRGATVLYLSPTKALAQDQLAALRRRSEVPGLRGHHARRRQPARAAGLGPRPRGVRAHQPRHAAPLAAARARALGAVLLAAAATSSSTSATTTAASSAPTSRWCCGGCAGSARSYGAAPDLRARLGDGGRAGGLGRAADRAAGRGGHRRRLAAGPGVAGALGAAVHVVRRRERRAGAPIGDRRGRRPAGRPGRRAASAPWRSSGPAAAPRRSR